MNAIFLYPDDAGRLYVQLRNAPDIERKVWWQNAAPQHKLWLVARVDPLEGFRAAVLVWESIWHVCGPRMVDSPNYTLALQLVQEFVDRGGRLPPYARQAVLENLALQLRAEEEPWSICTNLLVMGLEYANRVNRTAGWYPPVAFEIFRAARANTVFCKNPEIAEALLRQPVF